MSDNYIGQGLPNVPATLTPIPALFAGGHLYGGILSNTATNLTNGISVTAGEARDSANLLDIRWPALANKQLDNGFVAGANAGMRDTGAIANGTWHIFAIRDTATGASGDILASLSPTAPTLPAGYNAFRRIGSIMRIAGANLGFFQVGDYVELMLPVGEAFGVTLNTPTLRTLTRAPTGISPRVTLGVLLGNTAGAQAATFMWNPALGAVRPSGFQCNPQVFVNSAVAQQLNATFDLRVDDQARLYNDINAAFTTYTVVVVGWFDSRGRIAP